MVKRAMIAGAVLSLLASGAAYGYWGTMGTGSGSAQTGTAAPLTLTPGTPTTRLYPGGSADVAVTVTNPNPYAVRVGRLALDTAQGTGGFAVDAGHAACGVASLAFATQSNGGDGWTIPANGALSLQLAGALTMTTAAANACQGATFSVYLATDRDAYAAVRNTSGLVSYWRLGADPDVADNFTGTPATALPAHTGTVATSWTTFAGTDPVLSAANRVRRSVPGWSLVHSGTAPASADYTVEADVYAATLVAGDSIGVVGRLNTSTSSYYSARYRMSDQSWHLYRTAGGTNTSLASAGATLSAGQTYRVRLDLAGTTLTLSIDGMVVATATDATLAATGRAGLQLGENGVNAAVSDSTGLHADNFRVFRNSGSAASDSAGANSGAYLGSVVQNEPGALAGDLNAAVVLNGSTGAMRVAPATGLPVGAASRSVEIWFKRSGTTDAALFSYGSASAAKLFAARLTSANNLRVWGFALDRDFTLPYPTSDNVWHHVVVTYDGGVLRVYLDGTGLTPLTATLDTTVDGSGFTVGSATGAYFFGGSLDEVAVYSQVLSPATITDHYRAGRGT
ncbi:LamG domain-containing protein [Actinoplanes friuliensis]|uniref:Laminin G sub domain 2 n=1 Tax=Actinoplanes friuliensis DSM 7358 TaxID=1246995 RepID=U5VPN0_9ACTN|nr:LamG domain-containing protein [Actinoplanes friuliensis]AGZ38759.1 laminin G sub domain 2 [Actinoplanes friuliensis DSM 7358]